MAETLRDNRTTFLAAVLIFSAGIILAGYLLGDGLRRARMAERSVTVRGLAERNVTADLATWTLAYSQEGPELGPAQASVDESSRTVRDFFVRMGFKPEELSDTGASVSSHYDNQRERQSVTVRRRLQLRTKDVMKARTAFARQA